MLWKKEKVKRVEGIRTAGEVTAIANMVGGVGFTEDEAFEQRLEGDARSCGMSKVPMGMELVCSR